jgi:peptide/nickel transport system substrate-binding protein
MVKRGVIGLVAALLLASPMVARSAADEMTEFGTKRAETVIVQTFDARSAAPDVFNRYMTGVDNWHGARMLAHSYLWETDTGTGKTVSELAAEPPQVLDPKYTKFRIKLRKGIYWSDGVEFTADDLVYTVTMAKANVAKLPSARRLNGLAKSITKVDKYTVDVESSQPDYYFAQNWGVWSWGAFMVWIVPQHVYEKQADVSQFKDSAPVTLGAYVLDKFDPNGFWHIWRLRDDWQRSSWQVYTKRAPAPKYVVYQNLGPEDKQALAFIQNKFDAATFMSWESIKAVQQRNKDIKTFSAKFPHFWMDDACAWGVHFNAGKVPYNSKEVRWALALAIDLKSASMSALGGAFRVSAIPMVDQPWMKKAYFDPLVPWLEDLTLDDGYKPFNRKYAEEMKGVLKQQRVADLPADGDETYTLMGAGWWKFDQKEAEKLMLKAGMKRGPDSKWRLPDGSRWQPVFTFPGDWNAIMQRLGFAVADSWRKFGIEVAAKQTDNAEWDRIRTTNSMLDAHLAWPQCSYVTPVQFMQNLRQEFLLPADSSQAIVANPLRWDNKNADAMIAEMLKMPADNPKVVELQREVLKLMIQDMAVINLTSIPTTIPVNYAYWKGWPTADNYYATPLTWWSSFKHVVMKLEPTGKK